MMQAQDSARIDMEAATWLARSESDDMDWDGFASWLDADGAHRRAYDDVALLGAEIVGLSPDILASLPANDDIPETASPGRSRWWAIGGLALAASLAGVIALPMLVPEATTVYATGPAETRTVILTDGTTVRLDRSTRLVTGGKARQVTLASGTAFFDVVHDSAHPFSVGAGDYQVRDIGTRFDMSRDGSRLTVAVQQGEVAVGTEGGAQTSLKAGRRIDIAAADGTAQVGSIDPASVGSWQQGRLVYDDAPLSLVAADVSRYARTALVVDPDIADMRFTGILMIGDGSHLINQLQGILPVKARRNGDGTRLSAAKTVR